MYRFPAAAATFVVLAAGVGTAQTGAGLGAPRVSASVPPGRLSVLLPGTRPNVFTTIQGNALDSTNRRLADTTVRLRDARAGRIIDVQTTDQAGLFAFQRIDPGSYIVELVARDATILAASQILNVNAGEAVSAIVKLPFRPPALGGLLGHTAPSAMLVSSAAAASGVLATAVTGQPASPVR